ncbi:MAG: GspH/FimT family pseudopilin [Phycisphaeraceae bacterium]
MSRGGTGAFTLIEVLMVVAIMGVIGAIVVPHMLHPGTLTIQAAPRIIIADIIYAQNEAIAQQANRRVVFEPTLNRYRLIDANGTTLGVSWKAGGASSNNYVVDFSTDSRFSGVVIDSVNFGGATPTILEFDDMGAPLSGGTIELGFKNTRYRVEVTPFTGRVTVAPVAP